MQSYQWLIATLVHIFMSSTIFLAHDSCANRILSIPSSHFVPPRGYLKNLSNSVNFLIRKPLVAVLLPYKSGGSSNRFISEVCWVKRCQNVETFYCLWINCRCFWWKWVIKLFLVIFLWLKIGKILTWIELCCLLLSWQFSW